MDFIVLIKKMMKDYCVIVTGTVIGSIIINEIFYAGEPLASTMLWEILIFAFFTDLPSFVFLSRKELSEKQWNVRKILHFLTLEVCLVIGGIFIRFIRPIFSEVIVMILIGAGVYTVVWSLGWRSDNQMAKQINEKLIRSKEKRDM